jgi:Galactose oxidase, central domain/Kelch motif
VPIAFSLSIRLVVVPLLLLVSHHADRGHGLDDAPPSGAVVPTAAMRLARYAHTATTLADGRVLVLGGFTSEVQAAHSAEAYDPVAGRFRSLPRMITVRHSHTATRLPDGKVLIAGGYAEGSATVAKAELFDPATNTFTPTAPLQSARAGHVAVLLKNGKVLIAGGVGPEWRFLSSAELYDPATGRFAPVGDMTVARESHAAVRLQDGRVLIVGGHRGRRADITLYASAEVFDPADHRFRRVGEMQTRRHKHDAVLLADGRVLVTGGSDERDDRGAYRSTEVFDPARGTFSPGSPLAFPRYKHNGSSVLLPTGTVLLAGGAAEAEVFDPRSGRTAAVAGATQLSGQFSAVAMTHAGQVLITGGYGNGQGPQSSAWVYRP